jgi:hypothetical protein
LNSGGAFRKVVSSIKNAPLNSGGHLEKSFHREKFPLEFMGAFRKVVSSIKNAPLNSGGHLEKSFHRLKMPP